MNDSQAKPSPPAGAERWLATLIPLAVAALVLAIGGAYLAQVERHWRNEQHALAERQVQHHASRSARQLQQALLVPELLATVLRQYGELRDFESLAGELARGQDSLAVVRLTRPGSDPSTFPLRAAPAQGLLDALEAAPPPARLSLAGGSGEPRLLMIRHAVRQPDADGRERTIAHISAGIDIGRLLTASRLPDLAADGFDYSLSLAPADGAPIELAADARSPLADAPAVAITLPAGDTLTLRAVPRSIAMAPALAGGVALLAASAVLLAALTHVLLRRPRELADEVGRRTAELAAAIERLRDEVASRQQAETEARGAHRFLAQLLDTIPSPVFAKDAAGRYLRCNQAFADYLGRPLAEITGRTVFELWPPDIARIYDAADRRLLDSPGTQTYEAEIEHAADGRREVMIHKATLTGDAGEPAGLVGVILDISERKRAERRLDQVNRTYAVLSGINELIVRVRDPNELLERACRILVGRGGFPLAWVYEIAAEGGAPLLRASCGEPAALIEQVMAHFGVRDAARPLPGVGGDDERVFLCQPLAGTCAETAAAAAPHGLTALAVLALRCEGRVTGGLALFGTATAVFDTEELRLLGELADDLSFALDAFSLEARRRHAEDSLRLAARVFENSAEGIMITDARNNILMVNKAFTAVTGYAREEVIGQNPKLLSSGQQDPAFYRSMWQSLAATGEWHGEVKNRRKTGEFYPEWLTISSVKNDAGEITNYVAVFTDITTRKEIEERLNFLAYYDTLTGLPNRILFTDRLDQAIDKAHRSGKGVGVMFLDLDRFKLVNETFGHQVGDELLKEVSSRLLDCVRQGDSVSRLGGDEFTVVLPELDSPEDAAAVARRILQSLAEQIDLGGTETYTAASIGISIFPEDGADAAALVKNADSAMYRAMEEGGNAFRFYKAEMNARSSERISLETQLRYALERGELAMHYQPLVSARSGRIVGAEALMRWIRPGIGLVSPASFIPLLEETGLIVPVGEWVLAAACEQNKRWRQMGHGEMFVAVNFSALQLAEKNVVQRIERSLDQAGFDPRFLEIELTESMVMKNADQAVRTLNELKELGVRLSVDDFGTGYSSLSYLKRFPIDTLKIDRSFVHDAPSEADAVAIIEAIVAMGHSLRLKIIAEGVQTTQQAHFLRERQCDILQGYYFSRAVDQDDFAALVGSREAGFAGELA